VQRGLFSSAGLERAGGERLESVHGFRDIRLGTGELDEHVGITGGDDRTEEGVVGAWGFGAAEGRTVEVGAVGDDEGDFFASGGKFFALGGRSAFELAEPAGDVGFGIASLSGTEVVEHSFEGFLGAVYGELEGAGAHGAGGGDDFPGGGGFEGEVGDFQGVFSEDRRGGESENESEGAEGGFHGRWERVGWGWGSGGNVKSAAHLQPMTWKGRDERVVAGVGGEDELDGDGLTGLNQRSVSDDVGGLLGNVVFFDGLRIGDHGRREGADGVDFARLDQNKVMGLLEGGVDVVKRERDAGAGFTAQFGLVEGERDLGMRSQFDG